MSGPSDSYPSATLASTAAGSTGSHPSEEPNQSSIEMGLNVLTQSAGPAIAAYHSITTKGQAKLDAYWEIAKIKLQIRMAFMSEAQRIVLVHYSALERCEIFPYGTYLKCLLPGGAHQEGVEEIKSDAAISMDGTIRLYLNSWKGNYDSYVYEASSPPDKSTYIPVFPNSTKDSIRFVHEMFPDIPFKPVHATVWTRCIDTL